MMLHFGVLFYMHAEKDCADCTNLVLSLEKFPYKLACSVGRDRYIGGNKP